MRKPNYINAISVLYYALSLDLFIRFCIDGRHSISGTGSSCPGESCSRITKMYPARNNLYSGEWSKPDRISTGYLELKKKVSQRYSNDQPDRKDYNTNIIESTYLL